MIERRDGSLVRIRPRPDVRVVSQGRTVLITDPDGFFDGGRRARAVRAPDAHALPLSLDSSTGEPPQPVALSQRRRSTRGSATTPGIRRASIPGPPDQGSGHMQPASETDARAAPGAHVGDGLHEDVEPDQLHPGARPPSCWARARRRLRRPGGDVAASTGSGACRAVVAREHADGGERVYRYDYCAALRTGAAHRGGRPSAPR